MTKPYMMPSEGYMRLPEILRVFPVSRSTWLAGVADKRFPQTVKLSARITAWRVEDIRKLLKLASEANSLADLEVTWEKSSPDGQLQNKNNNK